MNLARALTLSSTLLLLFFALSYAPCAHAQQRPSYIPPSLPNATSNGAPIPSPLERQMMKKMAVERNKSRQKQLLAESAQLLALAQKLNSDLAKSTQDQLSVSVVKEADKIAKLAKSIKNKMSYGY